VAGTKKKARKAHVGASLRAASKKSSGAKSSGRNVDLEVLRRRIVNHVGGKAFDMVKNTSEALTKTINVVAMKYLFEMIGLFPAGEPQLDTADDQNLAEVLMSRLGLTPAIEIAGEPAGDAAAAVIEGATQVLQLNAVE